VDSEHGVDPGGEGRPVAAARLTPYELAFMEGDLETRVFPEIREEAASRGVDTRRRERFGFLASGAGAIREVVPDDAGPEMLEEYRTLFYQAYNFWSYGRRLYSIDPTVARYLVEAAPRLDDWAFDAAHPSIYLQLPPNLFWASIDPEAAPEPVDGFFVTVCPERDPLGTPFDDVQVMMVLGIHRHRAGFSVVPFETQTGPGIPPTWTEPGRSGGADFENVLPGGEIAGLYSILTTAEALKLVVRLLWFVRDSSDEIVEAPPAERRAADRPGTAPLSRLPYHRVTLGEREGDAPA
jgi:hypothetical protein